MQILVVFLSRKTNVSLWAEQEQPISESRRAVVSPLLFACWQDIVTLPKVYQPKLMLLNSSSSCCWRARPDEAPKPKSMWDPFPLFLPVVHSWPILCCISGGDPKWCLAGSEAIASNSCRRASGNGNHPYHEMRDGSSCKKATRGSDAIRAAL